MMLKTLALVFVLAAPCSARDYFLTLGGGYRPEGNQASLEANVLFFQELLASEHDEARTIATFFSDGKDSQRDLQIAVDAPPSTTPATDFISSLFRFRPPRQQVEYRNHRVPDIAGPLDPRRIESTWKKLTEQMEAGDRFFIYVTAHGGSGRDDDEFNTTISCWNRRSLSAHEFNGWLDLVPDDVPVIMVMAQCYCGGFAHSIFQDHDSQMGIARGTRIGFFAQQHDLAAAGCRPDITNDQEYSSYFWGALAGRMRNGAAIDSADIDENGRVSFAEAHAYAVIASATIDIPLKASETLLHEFSRLGGNDSTPEQPPTPLEIDEEGQEDPNSSISTNEEAADLQELDGPITELLALATPIHQHTVLCLLDELGFDDSATVQEIEEGLAELRRASRGRFRGRGRRGRGNASSPRRQLLEELGELHPELSDRESWRDSELLEEQNQVSLMDEIRQLPSYEPFEESRKQFQESIDARQTIEMTRVKFQRLLNTLESIVLEANLASVAAPEIVEHYQHMLAVEASYLQSHP